MKNILFQNFKKFGILLSTSLMIISSPLCPIEAAVIMPDQSLKIYSRFDQNSNYDFAMYNYFSRGGYATVSTIEGPFGTGSLLLESDGDHISYSDLEDISFLSNNADDWTIDLRVKHNSIADRHIYLSHYQGTDDYWEFGYDVNDGLFFKAVQSGAAIISLNGGSMSVNSWHHVALIKAGDTYGIYKDGVQIAYAQDQSEGIYTTNIHAGPIYGSDDFLLGEMFGLRVQAKNIFSASPGISMETIAVPTLLSDYDIVINNESSQYLAETKIEEFTPELRALAQKLDFDPIKIYNWVYENIEYENYEGSRKGAQCTYLTKAGNEWDQSSLLLTLMRISGIHSRYVYGDFTQENYYFSKPVYVEILVSADNYRGSAEGQNKIWVPLQTWVKESLSGQAGIDLFPDKTIPPELDFDFDDYLSSVKQKSAIETFEEKIQTYLTAHYPGKSLKDVIFKAGIIKNPISIIPSRLLHQPGKTLNSPIVPDRWLRNLGVGLWKIRDGYAYFVSPYSLVLPEIAGKRFTLDFIPYSAEDAAIISGYGGLHLTPDNAAKVKPVFRLDGEILHESDEYFYTGEMFGLGFPDLGGYVKDNTATIIIDNSPRYKAGMHIQLALDALSVSEAMITKTKKELENISTDVLSNEYTREEYLGRLGHIQMTSFLLREYTAIKRACKLMGSGHSYTLNALMPTIIYINPGEILKDDEAKYLLHPKWNIDAKMNAPKLAKRWSSGYLDFSDPFHLFMAKLFMFDSSYNEGRIFEDWQDTQGASTVKTIMVANEQGIEVKTFTKSSIVDNHLDDLENQTVDRYDDGTIQTIIQELNDDQTVTMPVRKVQYEGMTVVAYMTIGPKRIGMMFNHDFGGASSSEVVKDDTTTTNTEDLNGDKAADHTAMDSDNNSITYNSIATTNTVNSDKTSATVTAGDPVNMVTGEFFHLEKPDFDIKSRGVKLEVTRQYKSKLIYNGPFGYGWTWNHGEHLIFENGNVIFYSADGVPFYLTSKGDGTYYYPAGTTFTVLHENDQYVLTRKDQSRLTFNDAGLLVLKEDTHGNALSFVYDSNNNLDYIEDPLGRMLTFTYNTDNKIAQITDFAGRHTLYEYTDDNLISFVDLENNIVEYEYLNGQENPANNHNMSRYTLPNGDFLDIGYYKNDTVAYHENKKEEVFNFQYSRLNRYAETWNEEGYYRKIFYNQNHDVIRVTTKEKTVELMEYDNDHNMTSKTDANGYETAFTYDENRNLLTQTNALGEVWKYEYDLTFNKPTKITDPNGNVTNLEYNEFGDLTFKKIEALDAEENTIEYVTQYDYDAYGNLVQETDPANYTRQYTYDGGGLNMIHSKDKNDNIIQFTYDNLGRVGAVTETQGADTYATTFAYNNYNQKTCVRNPLGEDTRFEYDTNRNLVKQTGPNGGITKYVYDTTRDLVTGAKITEIIDALGKKELFDYDKLGNLIRRTGKNGNVTRYVYDPMNRLIEEIDPFQNPLRYAYDANGNLIGKTDRSGNTTTFTYNAANRKISEEDAVGNPPTIFEYDANGNLRRQTNALGIVTCYEYNEMNKMTKKVLGDGLTGARVYRYEYDSLGRLIKETNPLGHYVVYEYDGNGNKTKEARYDLNDTLVAGMMYAYNSRDSLKKTTDPRLKEWHIEYDALQRKTAGADPLGNRVEYSYDAAGNVLEVKDPLGFITRFTYSLRNEKLSETNALGHTTRFSYDANGNLKTVTDPEGNTTEYYYDALNRRISQVNAVGAARLVNYDANGNVISRIDELGSPVQFEYDANNRLIKETKPYDASQYEYPGGSITRYNYDPRTFEYDALNRLQRITDPRGAVTTNTYNEFNELTGVTVTDSLDNVLRATSRGYDDAGRLLSTLDANSVETKTEYDVLGRVVKIIQAAGTADEAVTQFDYDANGNKIREINARGHETAFEYDGRNLPVTKTLKGYDGLEDIVYGYEYDERGKLTKVTDPKGYTTEFVYDAVGRKIKEINPKSNVMAYAYDSRGNLIQETTPEGVTVTCHYDEVNRKVKTVRGTDEKTFSYDARNRLIEETDYNGVPTVYTYDSLDRLVWKYEACQTADEAKTIYHYDANHNVTRIDAMNSALSTGYSQYDFEYDLLNRKIKAEDADNTYKLLQYDGNGNLTLLVKQDGKQVVREHDNLNRLKKVIVNGSVEQEFTYDALSRMLTAVDYNEGRQTNTVGFTYDCFSRVTTETQNGKVVSKQYDKNSNPARVDYPDGRYVEKTYDAANLLDTVSYQGSEITGFQYNKDGQLSHAALANGITQTVTYDPVKGLEQSRGYKLGATTLYAMNTAYDPDGNVTREDITHYGSATVDYQYDNLNRVKSATGGRSDENWEYDQAGNWTNFSFDGVQEPMQVNHDNEYIKRSLSNYNMYYDINGNYYKKAGIIDTYIYDWANRLIEIRKGSTTTEVSCTYDALNRRVRNNELVFTSTRRIDIIYDGDQIVQEYGAPGRTYIWGSYTDEPLMLDKWASAYYYLRDRQYNIVAMSDNSGNVAERYEYRAFGNQFPLNADGTNQIGGSTVENLFGYNGQRKFRDHRLYDHMWYYKNRIYDPRIGRFLQRDPAGYVDGVNLYAYVKNNPLRYLDAYGLTATPSQGMFGEFLSNSWNDWSNYINSDFTLRNIGDFTIGTVESIVAVKDAPGAIVQVVQHPIATVKAIPGAVKQFGQDLVTPDKSAGAIGNLLGSVELSLATAQIANVAKAKILKAPGVSSLDEITNVADDVGSVGYHATYPEAADSILKNGFKKGIKPGRLGSNGTYINSTPEGAIAEFNFHNPGVQPKIIEVKYNPGINAKASIPPGKYVVNHPLNVDSVSAPSVRSLDAINTNIINGSVKPIRILP